MEDMEIRVVREPDGTVAVLFATRFSVEFCDVVRIGLGRNHNAARLGKALVELDADESQTIRRLRVSTKPKESPNAP